MVTELPTVLLFAGLSCIFSDCSALSCIFSLYLGYQNLKDLQMQVIFSFVNGNDIFGVLPTGFGKRLCYAILHELFVSLLQPHEP